MHFPFHFYQYFQCRNYVIALILAYKCLCTLFLPYSIHFRKPKELIKIDDQVETLRKQFHHKSQQDMALQGASGKVIIPKGYRDKNFKSLTVFD